MNEVSENHEIEVFFDGGCPLCAREVALLRHWDRAHKICFTDIDQPDFDNLRLGKSRPELMDQMHGRLPDGTWLKGVEVFRRMYGAVGFRGLVALSRLPGLSQLLDAGYWIFAKNRLRLTGRCTGDTCIVAQPAAPDEKGP
jgi:predicted DCC family thiol-disulfide oxidoreductase YuxK